jgi:soluble lytic murein transglycosylase-like protein
LSRGDIHIARAAALALAILLVPARASADVLEIGPQGATWIAGGPRVLPAQQVDAVVSGPDHAFTQIAESAGPANWQALVAQVAAKYDISPALLEAVVWQESRWRTDAVSSAGARGLTQLMPGTG